MGGVQNDADLAGLLPFTEERNFAAWTTRIERWPAKVDATIAVLREAVAAGLLWPRGVMRRVCEQLEGSDVAPESHPFFAPFEGARSRAGAAYRAQARAAIESGVLPAQRRLLEFMTGEYVPAAPLEAGLAHIPGGRELYAFLVRCNTTTSLAPREIHDLGLREVARIRAEMEAVAPRTGYSGSLAEVFMQMRTDPANYYATGAELLAGYRALCKRIDPELVPLFHALPRMPYGVVPIPDAPAPHTTTAYYQPSALDGSRAGLFYVNLHKPESRPKYEMAVLSLHEAVPGHHLQFALGAELGALPAFRRSAYYVGYGEGWGLYAESLGAAMGLYDDPKDKMGALSYEMWRAVRLVVDTGIHAFGWSRERAIEYFLANAAKTRLDVENEIDRYITVPGQACAYTIGQLKILELRERAKARLGAAFDLRDFHAVVLGAGSVPLNILEDRVEAWLAK
jgi:uncharacterized protein (DUF885 family)